METVRSEHVLCLGYGRKTQRGHAVLKDEQRGQARGQVRKIS